MRGKLTSGDASVSCDRITPAYAGKTGAEAVFGEYAEDHPRGCGENSHSPNKYRTLSGSPPRMRGKLEEDINICKFKRITPADAGKTVFRNAHG